MIAEVVFMQPVWMARTNVREHRYRHADGWRMTVTGSDVSLVQEDGSMAFQVRGVGFTYVETADAPVKKGKGK